MSEESAIKARVAHHTPGRLRLQVQRGAEVSEAHRRILASVAALPGVEQVEVRPASRSVVVHYTPAQLELQRLLDEGVTAATIDLVEEGVRAVASTASGTTVGRSIVTSVGRVNTGIGSATGGTLDLRDIFPLTLFGFGLRRLAEGSLQPVPWYNLLYYGYSTFMALHGKKGSPASTEPDAREILARRYAVGEINRDEYREMLAEIESPAV